MFGKIGSLYAQVFNKTTTLYSLSLSIKQFKMYRDLNLRSESNKFLEENIGETLHDIGICKDFLDMIPETEVIKAKTDKWDHIKLRSFCTAKEIFNKMKRQLTA